MQSGQRPGGTFTVTPTQIIAFYDSQKKFKRLLKKKKKELTHRKLLDQKSWRNTAMFPTSGSDQKKTPKHTKTIRMN